MKLLDTLTSQGNALFRWRNYTPLLLFPLFFLAAPVSAGIESIVGESATHTWTFLCMGISSLGILIRAATICYCAPGTSGRNRHGQIADTLNTSGLYSIVRHPLYLGNYVGLLGLLLDSMVWWVVVIGSIFYWIVIERIILTEEKFLKSKFGEDFERWASQTPTFFPDISKWITPKCKFSWREVLKREYNGVMALAASYLALEAILDLYGEGIGPVVWIHEDYSLFIIFGFSLILLIFLRTLKKHTQLLTEIRKM